jgi:hypothetical protein
VIVSGLMALALLTGGPNGPDKPATTKYKMDLKVTQLLNTGDQEVASEITSAAYLAVTMSDTTDGRIASIVIDSVTLSADGMLAQQFPAELVSTANGQSVRAYIVDGKVSGKPSWSTEENPVVATVGGAAISALFIGLAPSRKVGDTWSDTSSVAAESAPNGVGNNQIIVWKITNASDDGLVVEGTSTGSIVGSNQGAEFSGTIEGSVAVTSPTGGPAHASKLTNTQKIEVLAPGAPNVITVNVQNAVSLEMIP